MKIAVLFLFPAFPGAFSWCLSPKLSHRSSQHTSSLLHMVKPMDRRTAFAGVLSGSAAALIPSEAKAAEVRGTSVTPFNALAFQYRGTDNTGLQASDISEPSVPYAEFLDKLSANEVEFVEFMAPTGDAAYVTFKGKDPIRIGEGYPIEDPNGWSSPSFVVRAVENKGVPYKFTVPALKKFQ